MSSENEQVEVLLRSIFDGELKGRVQRYLRVKVHPVIPHEFFSAASSECRDMFVAGNFYGSISLAQAVSEGLARFIAEKKGLPVAKEHGRQINILQEDRGNSAISGSVYSAFRRIRGRPREDRNDFHHLNKNVEQDYAALEKRAEEYSRACDRKSDRISCTRSE
jgi:hypothetical protein